MVLHSSTGAADPFVLAPTKQGGNVALGVMLASKASEVPANTGVPTPGASEGTSINTKANADLGT